jgi:K+-sensing histidine kinase KdpD
MPASSPQTDTSNADLRVPMPDVIQFVRQLSHDLRNQLNAAELQSAYLKEIAEDPEIKEEVQRLRGMLSEFGSALQRLTAALAPVKLTEMRYEAAAFIEDLQQKIAMQFPENNDDITWEIHVGGSAMDIDPQLLQQAMLELIANAFQHARATGPIRIHATANGELALRIIEPKTAFEDSTEEWGREPFRYVKHGHYSLGLHRARNIVEAHRGRLAAHHDPSSSSLITTVVLPLAGET